MTGTQRSNLGKALGVHPHSALMKQMAFKCPWLCLNADEIHSLADAFQRGLLAAQTSSIAAGCIPQSV